MTEQKIVRQLIGSIEITWAADEPLRWTASTHVPNGSADGTLKYEDSYDFSEFRRCFEEPFLLGMKNMLAGRYRKCTRLTVKGNIKAMVLLLQKIQALQLGKDSRLMEQEKIACIDIGLLIAMKAKLVAKPDWISANILKALKSLFKYIGEGTVFAGLTLGDFPTSGNALSIEDIFRSGVIAQALSREAQIAVMKHVEDAFDKKEIDLSLYTFWNLANHLFVRPESYRQITCGNLIVVEDEKSKKKTYALMVKPAKRRHRGPPPLPIPHELHEQMGEMLVLQRQSVILNNGPLYGADPLMPEEERNELESRLALFPRRSGKCTPFELQSSGVLPTSKALTINYIHPLQRRLENIKIGFNVMRHTIATNLAAAGCSAQTIQAVLKHATDNTARIYVDLATKELKERLSQGLEGLAEHFPAYQAFTTQNNARKNPQRAINSANIDSKTGEITESTEGECGKNEACQYAPLACYGCWRFIPALDADHSPNLEVAKKDITFYTSKGQAFKPLLDRAGALKSNIEWVIAQCNKKRQLDAIQSSAGQLT